MMFKKKMLIEFLIKSFFLDNMQRMNMIANVEDRMTRADKVWINN